jgi:ubiquinone/menaquinone biosynthesis C-methylase UbiE
MSHLDLAQGSGFLDIGCATGWAVREAAELLASGTACGIDISPKMVEKARAYVLDNDNIDLRVADAETIPYPDESFSCVLCTCSFHHYSNPHRALSEIKRVMKTHGHLVILESARDISVPIWMQDRWRRHFERSHVKYYTTSELAKLVADAGLRIVGDIMTIKKFLDHKKLFTALQLVKCTKT